MRFFASMWEWVIILLAIVFGTRYDLRARAIELAKIRLGLKKPSEADECPK